MDKRNKDDGSSAAYKGKTKVSIGESSSHQPSDHRPEGPDLSPSSNPEAPAVAASNEEEVPSLTEVPPGNLYDVFKDYRTETLGIAFEAYASNLRSHVEKLQREWEVYAANLHNQIQFLEERNASLRREISDLKRPSADKVKNDEKRIMYRTRLCKENPDCKKRVCNYAHNQRELRPNPLDKRQFCAVHQSGRSCPHGARCCFRHY